MSWATQRKIIITTILFLVIAVPVAFLFNYVFSKPPTCFDGVKNQDEQGIDCGGNICAALCPVSVKDLVTVWDPRLFKVADGLYSTVVYVENPNVNAGAKQVPYTFKFYDSVDKNVVIAERSGVIDIYPEKAFPILETGISTGKRSASRVTFSFDRPARFEKMAPRVEKVVVKDQVIVDEDTAPRVNARIQNVSVDTVKDVTVTAVIFDDQGNAIAVSQTFVEALTKNETRDISFSWLQPFGKKAVKIELYAKVE